MSERCKAGVYVRDALGRRYTKGDWVKVKVQCTNMAAPGKKYCAKCNPWKKPKKRKEPKP